MQILLELTNTGNRFARYTGVIFEQNVQQPTQLVNYQICNFTTFTCMRFSTARSNTILKEVLKCKNLDVIFLQQGCS